MLLLNKSIKKIKDSYFKKQGSDTKDGGKLPGVKCLGSRCSKDILIRDDNGR